MPECPPSKFLLFRDQIYIIAQVFFFFKSENLKVLEENLSDLILSEAIQRERREAKKGRMVTSGKGGGETSGY